MFSSQQCERLVPCGLHAQTNVGTLGRGAREACPNAEQPAPPPGGLPTFQISRFRSRSGSCRSFLPHDERGLVLVRCPARFTKRHRRKSSKSTFPCVEPGRPFRRPVNENPARHDDMKARISDKSFQILGRRCGGARWGRSDRSAFPQSSSARILRPRRARIPARKPYRSACPPASRTTTKPEPVHSAAENPPARGPRHLPRTTVSRVCPRDLRELFPCARRSTPFERARHGAPPCSENLRTSWKHATHAGRGKKPPRPYG